eukprot:CAMPEP_0184532138 /NCGR_PEP_ID=MMETSP0198_2-20121128/13983_1 /TAXON_ID=1112570 /ORGANISM="Thraustochytrium sp., Strain LLF1b" /LENGTH=113 /DNA_ID=CAMNT_0026924667 /DNA_START=464 /DNA_END=802 /DNA_ORIENTATION=+
MSATKIHFYYADLRAHQARNEARFAALRLTPRRPFVWHLWFLCCGFSVNQAVRTFCSLPTTGFSVFSTRWALSLRAYQEVLVSVVTQVTKSAPLRRTPSENYAFRDIQVHSLA